MRNKPVEPIGIGVACRAGYNGEEEPQAIYFGQRAVPVEEILDRWFATEQQYFKFRGTDGARYIIRHDQREQRWELTLFDSLS